MSKIVVRRLRGGTLFKLILIGNLAFFLPISLFSGVLAMFGASTITYNEQPLIGFHALIASPFFGLFLALSVSAFLWLAMFIGLWVYSRFRHIELEYIPEDYNHTSK